MLIPGRKYPKLYLPAVEFLDSNGHLNDCHFSRYVWASSGANIRRAWSLFPPFGAHAFYSPRIVVGTLFDYISVTSVLKYTKLLDLRSQTGSGNLAVCVFSCRKWRFIFSASFNNEGPSVKVSSMWSPVVTACCLDTCHQHGRGRV